MYPRFRTTGLAAALLLAGTIGCVRAMQGPQDSSGDIITENDIINTSATSAYEAVQKLHPDFLSYRGQTSLMNTSSPEPTVYLDGVRYGVLMTLRSIPASEVAVIRMYRAGASAVKFGSGNMGGVIEVTTKH